jgi:hypothetical protein
MAFAGFDRWGFPSDAITQKLQSTTNLKFVDFIWLRLRVISIILGWVTAVSSKLWDLVSCRFTLANRLKELVVSTPSTAKGAIEGNDAVQMMTSEVDPERGTAGAAS